MSTNLILAVFASLVSLSLQCKTHGDCAQYGQDNCPNPFWFVCHDVYNVCECTSGPNVCFAQHGLKDCSSDGDCLVHASNNCLGSTSHVICHEHNCECTLGPTGQKCLVEADCKPCPENRHAHCINLECHCSESNHEHIHDGH